MGFNSFFTVFLAVFIAELGDKTQIATLLFATHDDLNRWQVFFGAALALVTVSALSVLAGSFLSGFINQKYINYAAGIAFIGIGIWTLLHA